jgi:NAD-dependent DNA ligase
VGKTVAISGTLSGLTKADAWKMICEAGGTPVDNFTGSTNCLILGSTEFANYIPGGHFTNKMKVAIARIEKGEDVEVFDQQELFDKLQATS